MEKIDVKIKAVKERFRGEGIKLFIVKGFFPEQV